MQQVLLATLRQQARNPLTWALLVLALISWPISVAIAPLTTTLSSGTAAHLSYDIAFIALIVGALFGDMRLEELRWLLCRQSPPRVAASSVLLLASSSLLPATLCLVPMAILSAHVPGGVLMNLVLAALHLAVIVQLLNALGFSPSSRSVGIPILALLLPASIPSGAGPFSFLWRLLDPLAGAPLENTSFTMITFQLGSIVALYLLACAPRLISTY